MRGDLGELVAPDSAGAVLQLVRSGQAASRSDIARLTHVSASTAGQRVEALIGSGYVREIGDGVSRGGRRPRRLELRRDAGLVAAADLGGRHASLALFDFGGQLVAERHTTHDIADGPHRVLRWVIDQVEAMHRELGGAPPVRGLTVGVPGPVDHRRGQVVSPARMPGWNNVDVPALAAELTEMLVLVENDANLMALGEYITTTERAGPAGDTADHAGHLVFLKAGSGIGCGVIASGRLHHGARGAAGDISHVQVVTDPNRPDIACSCGRSGCLDAVASGAALVRQLRAAGMQVDDTEAVLAAAGDADPTTARLLREAGRATADVLATIVNFFNPDTLVLGGQLSQSEPYVASVRSTLHERCLPMAVENLTIVPSHSGRLAGVTGGAGLMLEHLLQPVRINSLVSGGF